MLITIATFRDPWEAHMFRSRLDAEGISAVVAHENHIWMNWPFSTALGGVKVQVPSEQADDARAVERQCRAGEYRTGLDNSLGDAQAPRCPRCGSTHYRTKRPLARSAFAIAASFLTGTVVPSWGRVWVCDECGNRFRP